MCVSSFLSLSSGFYRGPLLAGPGNRISAAKKHPNIEQVLGHFFPAFWSPAFRLKKKAKLYFVFFVSLFVVQDIISLFFISMCCGGTHQKDFRREVLVIAQSVCRRRPLLRRDPLPPVEFFLSP